MALYTVLAGGTIQANDLNQVVTALNGAAATPLTLAGPATLSGGVSGALTATGNVTANGNRCVEGSQDVTHVEVYPPQGSVANVASNAAATVTFTFRRPFSSPPACVGSCQNGGADEANVAAGKIVAFSTNGQGQYTGVTLGFRNLDPNPQTMSNFCVIAAGV